MGLLDSFNIDNLDSPQARMGLGLLAAAGPQAVPMSFGQRLAGAMGQMRAEKAAEEERKQLAAQRAMQAQLLQLQLEQSKRAEAMQLQQQANDAEFRRQIPSPAMQASQAALGNGGGPTVANAARIPAVDPMQQLQYEAMRLQQIKPLDYINAQRKDTAPMKVGAGEALVDPRTFKPVFTNPKEDTTPADWKLYQLSGAPQRGIEFDQWDQARRRAGATQIGMPKIELKTGEGLAAQVGPMLRDSRAQAEAGMRLVDSADRILTAAEKGNLFAGPTANLQLKGAQIADTFGFGGKNLQEKIKNTRDVVRGMAEQAVSARAQLGGQAQISNSEQELLNKATAGDIAELTAGEIIQIAKLNDRLGRKLYGNHQQQLKVMQQRPELQGVSQFFTVPDLPAPRDSATVVRTGRDSQGRKVEQLSNGTIRYGKD